MKTIFDENARQELVSRINNVTPQNAAQWGKMNAYQMTKHCMLCDDMFLGRIKINRIWIGRLIGPMVLRKNLKEGRPFGKNSPTAPILKTTNDSGDIGQQKKDWIDRIQEYADFKNEGFIHPFFGPMTKEQIGQFAYKHADHHLRQFGA